MVRRQRLVCPLCAKSGALRLRHGTESALSTSSRFHGRRYCLTCQQWVLPSLTAATTWSHTHEL